MHYDEGTEGNGTAGNRLNEKELNETEMEEVSGSGALDYLKEYGHEQTKDDHWSLW